MFYTNICANFWTELDFCEVPLECDCAIESLKCKYYFLTNAIFYKLF